MTAAMHPDLPEYGAAPQAVLLEDSGTTSYPNRTRCDLVLKNVRGTGKSPCLMM